MARAADGTLTLQATVPASKTGMEPWVELAKALAWPIAIVVLALWFRKPLIALATAIGGRVSKLSFAQLSIELEAARQPASSPLLDEIRDTTSSAPIGDSSRALMEQAGSTTPADFAVISLGRGDEWLTSRLYIAAAMMQRMRGIKVFVLVDASADSERHFLGTVDVRRLRWLLAQRYPWLEVAYVRAEAQALPADPLYPMPPVTTSANGALEPYTAQNVVQTFIRSLQQPTVARVAAVGDPPEDPEWVTLDRGVRERAAWVTRRLVSELLSVEDQDASVVQRQAAAPAELSRAVLAHGGDFIAVVDERGQYVKLLDRRGYLESVARQVGEAQRA